MKDLLGLLLGGGTLTSAQAEEAFELIMSGQATAAQMGAFLALLGVREPTVAEIVGAAKVMRQKVTAVPVPEGLRVIDTCGTGGTGSRTFNVSTSAALVVAAVGRGRGVAVAKHGNRSVTSKSGASQVLEELGVTLAVSPATQGRCLREAGMCFCFAPAHHPAMKHAAPVRAELGFRTIFNLLGPLTNPAGAKRQVMGVSSAGWTTLMAQALGQLGAQRAMVVHGTMADGTVLGEVVTSGVTRIAHWDGRAVREEEMDAGRLGIKAGDPKAFYVDGPKESAQVIRKVLAGEKGPARDMVELNAAAGLMVAELAGDWKEGMAMASAAIDSKEAARTLCKLVEITRGE
ncbi:MAG: anthranilate phosphoribosyltransferase [Phycisphaeraceae bacterium]|nr:anthranilate phosphoribosyltransferase [Phycisphaeraceae bacterium]